MSRVWTTRVLGLCAVALVAGSLLVLSPAAGADSLPEGWAQTRFGPLGPADRDLLIKVRQAGLWEMPAGVQAQRRAVDPKVREIGTKIAAEHHELDEATRSAAAQLGVALPDEPNAYQQGWLDEMDSAQGKEFDRIFIDRLRAAHGSVFAVIAGVRAGTRNELVRSFAATSNAYVLRHMGYLESSGLVDWEALPLPPNPPRSAVPGRGVNPVVIWLLLATAAVVGAATLTRVIRVR
jgi:predicted outer membrane protein